MAASPKQPSMLPTELWSCLAPSQRVAQPQAVSLKGPGPLMDSPAPCREGGASGGLWREALLGSGVGEEGSRRCFCGQRGSIQHGPMGQGLFGRQRKRCRDPRCSPRAHLVPGGFKPNPQRSVGLHLKSLCGVCIYSTIQDTIMLHLAKSMAKAPVS